MSIHAVNQGGETRGVVFVVAVVAVVLGVGIRIRISRWERYETNREVE